MFFVLVNKHESVAIHLYRYIDMCITNVNIVLLSVTVRVGGYIYPAVDLNEIPVYTNIFYNCVEYQFVHILLSISYQYFL